MDDAAQKPGNLNTQTDQNQITPTGSSLNKEAGSVSDFVAHSEQAPKIEAELKEAGVEAVTETPKLTEVHEKIGIRLSPESSRPDLDKEPAEIQGAPISQANAQQVVKTNKNIKDSILWFAILMLKNFKKMGKGTNQNAK